MTRKKCLFIADPLSPEALAILEKQSAVQVENQPGLELDEKLKHVKKAHGLIVRSETKVDAKFLASCDHLEIIVRAGVGVDNIDVAAATRKGVVVQNVPEGNVRSAAEHTIGMLVSLARNIPQACTSMREGKWERSKYVGTELQGKVLGVVGLGKIGRQVIQMATGLGMKAIGFDPFVSPKVAEDLGVQMAPSMGDLLSMVDFVTIHVPLVPETRNLLSKEVLSKAKPGLRLINCARGGIVDEAALLEALESGSIGGAAIDVFAKEPPEMSDLIKHPKVICTPHLGASTKEAQKNVAIAAARQIVDYFVHGKLSSPVNTLSLEPELRDEVKPYYDLAYGLGLLQAQILESNPARIRIGFYGDLFDSKIQRYLSSAALCGFIKDRSAQPVNPVNAHHLASEMGLVVEEASEGKSKYFHQLVKIGVEDTAGKRELGGTIRGQKGLRLVSLDDYHFDAVLEGRLLLVKNKDKPGMIGVIGNVLASHQVNISYMSLGRDRSGGTAIALLNLDDPVPPEVVNDLEKQEGILWARLVLLPLESS
ncbi:MAG: phosphoglycerate dehydrogenase [Planctomycetes bacterium]|nr:phosphoglycerate dehydrogenase [Planctomycetota bacterium]